ncbi:MAG: hypothetical protein ACLR8Y_05045 [Alistipes indistinctus]
MVRGLAQRYNNVWINGGASSEVPKPTPVRFRSTSCPAASSTT